jgi:hypothetical protein
MNGISALANSLTTFTLTKIKVEDPLLLIPKVAQMHELADSSLKRLMKANCYVSKS